MTTQDEYVAHMGERLGRRFDELWQELAWLNVKWAEHVELFGTKETRIKLLNESASLFFRIVQDTLLEDVLLHIARLTERSPFQGEGERLTVHILPGLVDVRIRKSVSELVKRAQLKASICKEWRDRHIAHRNAALALKEAAPLEPITSQYVREALAAIGDVLNEVHRHYLGSDVWFEAHRSAQGAGQLLYVIDYGLKAMDARHERLRSGNPRKEDFDLPAI
jgi:hypothetical protein